MDKLSKLFSGLVFACLLCSLGLSFTGGTGDPGSPYLIENCDQLQNMSSNLTAHYQLNANFSCDVSPYNSDSGFDPIGNSTDYFNGSLHGENHTINDLYMNRTATGVGLFGYTGSNVNITNLGLSNAEILGPGYVGGLIGWQDGSRVFNSHVTGIVESTNRGDLGGLVGSLEGGGKVNNSYSTASVSGGGNTTNAGGLVGDLALGNIYRSYATGDVNASGLWVGGLVGSDEDSEIRRCYSTGDVYGGTNHTGGLVGAIGGDGAAVGVSYSTGSVTGEDNVGGLIGYDSGSMVINSFWENTSSNINTSAGGIPKNQSQMKDVDTYTNLSATPELWEPWDFVGTPNNDTANKDIWGFDCDTNSYPLITSIETQSLNTSCEGVVEANVPPNVTLNSPVDGKDFEDDEGEEGQSNVTLNVTVTDSNDDSMDVTFYNAEDNSEICSSTSVSNGTSVTCQWSGLSEETTYQWYVNVSDGLNTTHSDTWSFTTSEEAEEIDTTTVTTSPGLELMLVIALFTLALSYIAYREM